MRLVALEDQRLLRTPDGRTWSMYPIGFVRDYLRVFDSVRVVARSLAVTCPPKGALPADFDGVEYWAAPHYQGPAQFLLKAVQVYRSVRASFNDSDAILLRVPSQIATCAEPLLRRAGHPYAVQVVGDPAEVFAPGVVRHPLRAVFRRWYVNRLVAQCAHASVASYVSEQSLLGRYPPSADTFVTSFSDVHLDDQSFVAAPRQWTHAGPGRIVAVGSLDQLYKGPDIALSAILRCRQRGFEPRLDWFGTGRYQARLEARVHRLSLTNQVRFHGHVSGGEQIRRALDAADLFILPSRTEGLPRSLLEAMARALPCIASSVGGIAELLDRRDLVPPGCANALAEQMMSVFSDPRRMTQMAQRNWRKARSYHQDQLLSAKLRFLRELQHQTHVWQSRRVAPAKACDPRGEKPWDKRCAFREDS